MIVRRCSISSREPGRSCPLSYSNPVYASHLFDWPGIKGITIGLKPNFETWRAIFKRLFLSESFSKKECCNIFLKRLYHFKVPKKVKIGEKCPKSVAFKWRTGLARDNFFVSSASRICELKKFSGFLKLAFEITLCWKTRLHVIFGPFFGTNGE